MKGLEINLPLGRVAAFFTVFEYVLGLVTALAVRAFLRGLWLFHLHRSGKASINPNDRDRRALRRDLITTALGIWLIISAALVESQLTSVIQIGKEIMSPNNCIPIDRPLTPDILDTFTPPIQLIPEPWVVLTVLKMKCGKYNSNNHGLATLGVDGRTTLVGDKTNCFAPKCLRMELNQIDSIVREVKLSDDRFLLRPGKSPAVEIFPYSFREEDLTSFGVQNQLSPCASRNLSSFYTTIHQKWITTFATSADVAQAVHNLICEEHRAYDEDQNWRPLRGEEVIPCAKIKPKILNVECLFKIANNLSSSASTEDSVYRDDFVHTVSISNVSAMIYGLERSDPSYACITVNLEVEYILIEPAALTQINGNVKAANPVIMPTGYRAVSGHCERTIHVLGRAALLHSADSEWRQTSLVRLDRLKRYWAYMITVSNSLFPLVDVDVQEADDDLISDPCVIHPVEFITLIKYGWHVLFFLVAFIVCIIIIIIAIVSRLYYRGPSWLIGSAHWSLERFANSLEEEDPSRDVDIEVVARSQKPSLEDCRRSGGEGIDENEADGESWNFRRASFESDIEAEAISTRLFVGSVANEQIYGYSLRRIIRRITVEG